MVGDKARMIFIHIPTDTVAGKEEATGTIITTAEDMNELKRMYKILHAHFKKGGTFQYVSTKEELKKINSQHEITRPKKRQRTQASVTINNSSVVSNEIPQTPTAGSK